MSGVLPNYRDGARPPSEVVSGYDTFNTPIDTAILYFGNECDITLRPELMNSVISEIICVIDSAELVYDASETDNLARAIPRMIERSAQLNPSTLVGPVGPQGVPGVCP